MNIFQLLHNDTEGMSEEELKYATEFTEKLKEKIIDELVQYEAENLIKKLDRDKDDFIESLGQILTNGTKGFNKMPMQLLVNIYLEKKNEEEFTRLIDSIS
ncbi:hypothetical protein ACQPU1_06070 [Clostridium paraputrificum]|uniref:hypothetical protein n=1 Tax=Clostridium TaxID=1485 RepID=UPI003D32E27F